MCAWYGAVYVYVSVCTDLLFTYYCCFVFLYLEIYSANNQTGGQHPLDQSVILLSVKVPQDKSETLCDGKILYQYLTITLQNTTQTKMHCYLWQGILG